MLKMIVFAVVLLVGVSAVALDDTPENRAKQAERYLKACPPKKLLMDQLEVRSRGLPEKNRERLRKAWAEHIDWHAITKIAREALIKHFTADELRSFTDPDGVVLPPAEKHRQEAYSADVVPRVERELLKGLEKAKQTASLKQAAR